MPKKRYRWAAASLLAPLAFCACGGGGPGTRAAATSAPTVASTSVPAPSTTPAPPPSTIATSTTTGPPPSFRYRVSAVTAADLPYTWRPGCPVAPSALRAVQVAFWGFDGHAHTGVIVVNQSVVTSVVRVFRTLYDGRFPLREVVPQDAYHGDDNAAAAADDTSGFNCRNAVAPGPPQWSVHAFGEAIDVNDVENPYVDGSTVIPPSGVAYLDRSDVRPGMATPGGLLVEAFASVGWKWGGRWSPGTDYQHFSLTGG